MNLFDVLDAVIEKAKAPCLVIATLVALVSAVVGIGLLGNLILGDSWGFACIFFGGLAFSLFIHAWVERRERRSARSPEEPALYQVRGTPRNSIRVLLALSHPRPDSLRQMLLASLPPHSPVEIPSQWPTEVSLRPTALTSFVAQHRPELVLASLESDWRPILNDHPSTKLIVLNSERMTLRWSCRAGSQAHAFFQWDGNSSAQPLAQAIHQIAVEPLPKRRVLFGGETMNYELAGDFLPDTEISPATDWRPLPLHPLILIGPARFSETLRSARSPALVRMLDFPRILLLDLSDSLATDRCAPVIQRARNLRLLWLQRTRITDAFLPALLSCPQLTFLDLSETRVTPEAIRSLRTHLPDATVLA